VEFYKELAKKLREYGIDRIKADIEKSDLTTKRSELLEYDVIVEVTYTIFPTESHGQEYRINFVNWK